MLLLAAFAAGAVSCTVPRYVSAEPAFNDEWTGRTYEDIVQTFGAPEKEVSDGRGGSIIVYQDAITDYIDDYIGPVIIRRGENYMQFFVDEDDVCYKVLTDKIMQDGRRFDFIGSLSVASLVTMLIMAIVVAGN